MLPPDDQRTASTTSPTTCPLIPRLMDRYLVAARRIGRSRSDSRRAIRRADLQDPEVLHAGRARSRRTLPFGTRGGLAVRHYFPLDGEYTFQVKLERNHSEVLRGMTDKSQLEIRVDRERVKVFTVGGLGKRPACYVTNTCPQNPDDLNQADDGLDVRLTLKAGTSPDWRRVHRRAAREARGSAAVTSDGLAVRQPGPRQRDGLHGRDRRTVQRRGAGRYAEPPRHLRLPARSAAPTRRRAPTEIISRLARRAFRRPSPKPMSTC